MSPSRYERLSKLAQTMNDPKRTEGERQAAETLYNRIVNSQAFKVHKLYTMLSAPSFVRSTFEVVM